MQLPLTFPPSLEEKRQNPQHLRDLPLTPENVVEPYSQKSLEDLAVGGCVLLYDFITQTGGSVLLVDARRLLEDVVCQLQSGSSLFEVRILGSSSEAEKKILKPFALTRSVWALLLSPNSCPVADKFQRVFFDDFVHRSAYEEARSALDGRGDLEDRIGFFIYDLLNLTAGEARLNFFEESDDPQHAALFLNRLYFTPEEQKFIYAFPLSSGKRLFEFVGESMQAKFNGQKIPDSVGHVCSSHDLAPILRKVFGLDTAFYKSKEFKTKFKKFTKHADKMLAAPPSRPASRAFASSSSSASSSCGC